MPFVLFSFSLSLTIGSVIGGIMGFMWRQQWAYVENRLYEIENGHRHMPANEPLIQETSRIISRLNKVDHKMILQAQQSQKMATEKWKISKSKCKKLFLKNEIGLLENCMTPLVSSYLPLRCLCLLLRNPILRYKTLKLSN